MPTLSNRETETQETETQEITQEAEAHQPSAEPNPSPALHPPTPAKHSHWRKLRMGVASHPRLIQLTVLLILLSATSTVLLYDLFKGAWPQHQDNADILGSILKMELGRESSRAIHEDNAQRVVTRSFSTLESYVEADGWKWLNRVGSTMTYGKQEQRLIASCSPYSPLYVICDLSEIP